MSDDKDWRAPDAKPMTFDQMTARAQYEWDRAEKAEAEALHCAQALTEARASAAHWRRAIEIIATIIGLPEPEANFASKVRDAFDELRSQLHDANGVAELAIKHRDAAESELSTLRARVREVVGRIVAIENKEYGGDYDEIDEAREIARQLNEDLK